MGYFPSKNFIAPVSAILVVLFTGWFITRVIWDGSWMWEARNEKNSKSADSQKRKTLSFEEAMQQVALDTDSDGLKDWEEILWKTDPHQKDSDGDGTNDGEEVALSRDPLVSALKENDKIKKLEEERAGGKNASSTQRTISEKAAELFAKQYFGAKGANQGNALSNLIKEKITGSFSYQIQKGLAAYKDKYSKKDIKISESVSPKEYLNRLGGALNTNFKNVSVPEIEIMDEVAETGDFGGLAAIKSYLPAYKKTLDFLIKEPVPSAYASIHVMLLNSMQNTLYADENMIASESDPLRGMIGLQLYYRELARARLYLATLKNKTGEEKVVFADTEPGSFFNQYFAKIQ